MLRPPDGCPERREYVLVRSGVWYRYVQGFTGTKPVVASRTAASPLDRRRLEIGHGWEEHTQATVIRQSVSMGWECSRHGPCVTNPLTGVVERPRIASTS